MEMSYNQLPTKLRDALYQQIKWMAEKDRVEAGSMNAQDISNILFGLAKMNAKFAEIPADSRQSLLKILHSLTSYFIEQNLSNSIYR